MKWVWKRPHNSSVIRTTNMKVPKKKNNNIVSSHFLPIKAYKKVHDMNESKLQYQLIEYFKIFMSSFEHFFVINHSLNIIYFLF